MSPTEPRSEQEIRADLAARANCVSAELGGETVGTSNWRHLTARLAADVAPLVNAVSAALAAKEAAETENERLLHGMAGWVSERIEPIQARAERAEAQVRAVEALHAKNADGLGNDYCEWCDENVHGYGTHHPLWPCPTMAALAAVSPPEEPKP